MNDTLLHYRPWRGSLHGTAWSVWPIARISLWLVFRRKLYWVLYAFALTIFLMFFFGQYLLAWAETQATEETVRILGIRTNLNELIGRLRDQLKLNGSVETYGNFFRYQGSMVMIVLAMTGSVLVGNDFQAGSLTFYLSKPLGHWHYLLGKFLAVALFVNLTTTFPAVVLFIQYGMLDTWDYYVDNVWFLAGILGYGLLLTVCLSLFLVAMAGWLRRTVPLVMGWTTVFYFFRLLADKLVDGLNYDPRWRLIDLWNNMYLVGSKLLGMEHRPSWTERQPAVAEAAYVLGAVCLLCLIYLNRRIRAVEIVS